MYTFLTKLKGESSYNTDKRGHFQIVTHIHQKSQVHLRLNYSKQLPTFCLFSSKVTSTFAIEL